MRALWRLSLAPISIAAAVLFAGAPASFAATAPAHHAVPKVECPAGTNWDHILQICR